MTQRQLTPIVTRGSGVRTIQDLVALNLRRWVVDGTLRPGDRINVDAVATALECSIIPVREALRVLAKENIITLLPHRGAFVRVLSSDEIAEVYWIRQTLESRALGNAVPNLSEADWAKLQTLVDEMTRVIAAGDVLAYMELDSEYHLAMYRPHNSPYLVGLCADAHHASQAYRLAHAMLPGRAEQGNLEHQQILDALRRRDTQAAQQILRLHYAATAKTLAESLRNQARVDPSTPA